MFGLAIATLPRSCRQLKPGATLRAAVRAVSSSFEAKRRWGVALDIDGVLIRGGSPIPGSAEAVRRLRAAGVPHVFMTNGGGVPEAAKAAELAARLGDAAITEGQVLLSHTPMRQLAKRYAGRRVVVVGSAGTPQVAAHYGFDVNGLMAITPSQIAAGTPGIYGGPFRREDGLEPVDVNADGAPPIEAILVFHDPGDWGAELQILTDVLVGGRPYGVGATGDSSALVQCAAVYASNPDFVWQAGYEAVRYGQGAFLECLRALWHRRCGGSPLDVVEFGKPHPSQYRVAEQLLAALDPAAPPLQRLYMIGDNPAADIRGGNNAGEAWRSILVCTGVYRGGPDRNDEGDPAWRVEPDLASAVDRLLDLRDEQHLEP